MATSETSICNLALQKLGADRITSLSENAPNARECNACYTTMRDIELRAYRWNFAKTRVSLTAHATTPVDGTNFDNAFPLPSDFLRLLSINESNVLVDGETSDWKIELHQGVKCLLTNDTAPVLITYIARVTDATLFDPMFVDMLAAKLAWQMCEKLTQSNMKKADIMAEYKDAKRTARRINAFENQPTRAPEDTWVSVRR
jgi:hypothetical protein